MRRRIVLVATAAAMLMAGPAAAQYPPGTETQTTPAASFACENLAAGQTATCSVGGWQADSPVDVNVTAVFSSTVTAAANGFITYSFAVPAGAAGDGLAFTHSGTLLDGTPGVHTTTLTVAAAPAGTDDLTTTGSNATTLLLLALLALAVGTAVVVRVRGRRRTPEHTTVA